jgi:hypothetical protein
MGQAKQDRKMMAFRLEMRGQTARTDCQDKTAIHDSQKKTARTGLQCKTAKTGLPGHDFRDRTARGNFCYDIVLILAFILGLSLNLKGL